MMFAPGPEAREAYLRHMRDARRVQLIEGAMSWIAGMGLALALLLIHGALA